MSGAIPNLPPESFSKASAIECAVAIFDSLPKTKQRYMLGAYNELLVVLGRIKCESEIKEYKPE